MLNNQVNELLHKEMTRHEFLVTLGFGVASLFGLSSVLRLVGGKNHLSNHGYGASPYGR